jgi:hypothetical protein
MTAADTVHLPGVDLPAGHRLVSLATRPDLADALSAFNGTVWATFMLQDSVADREWHHTEDSWPETQLVMLDDRDQFVATANTSPLVWDGTDDGLPGGWDDQLLQAVADHEAGRVPDTLGALQIVVDPARQGTGLSGQMLQGMRALARERRMRAVIACVRPTWKERYPLVPIERYATWTRDDGLPFDPWMRLHARLGGRIVRAVPNAMTIRGSVADWESWTGMAFPESGDYVVPRAAALVSIDREQDQGTYHDPNVWTVHDLGREDRPDPSS